MNSGSLLQSSLVSLLPFLILGLGGVVLLVLDAIWPKSKRFDTTILGIPLVLLAITALIHQWRHPIAVTPLKGMYLADTFGAFLGIVICLSLLLTILLSTHYLKLMGRLRGEYFALLFLSAAGMILLASSTELLTLFLGLELLSFPVYILTAFLRKDAKSNEAGMKYFLLGAFSSAIFLYGAAMIYGATGQTDLMLALSSAAMPKLLVVGIVLLLSGLLFKVASVPFHMWAPDVYEGAPTAVTAFMATAVKAAAFGALIRILIVTFPALAMVPLERIFWWLAVLSMTVGNFAALTQSNIKRMLAYSSIAHAGYILVGVTALIASGSSEAVAGILYYLLAYTFMNICAFGVVIALTEKGRERLEIHELGGVGWRRPGLGLAMIVAMVALSGIPPTAGFFGKYYIFQSAVKSGLLSLVIIGVLNSALSVYYYFRVLVAFYMKPSEGELLSQRNAGVGLALAFSVIAILWLAVGPDGVIPGAPQLLNWVRDSFVALP
ncbi:MAG: NADH-quinone oxidoreductase subunit N [Candidatus Eisenbacteria bacterium]|uniref:NADH-quinone oxidoreductase subunit N n=1 Tax=Eiseniibacteriota bacterium TaxID=2212470 RepID=A0A948RXZ2_UNCEI|nr:NADH-quinone oxidoreductase subunit N [Candidatus Eisenbacteria bacterium]MBU1950289.1 NADH-quinone oxidoreductase subunit N [Candidatus Eisenbacteria bacterium]MBU2692895.1 NADH-quinone oxidoreductase subunit N [Candidatus Eisenbacteria bacterium]